MKCKDCTCEDCKHENLKYCECCGGVHCATCDEKWENHTRWRDFWYNAEDLTGPTHTFEKCIQPLQCMGGGRKDCACSEDSYMCVCDRGGDWNPT